MLSVLLCHRRLGRALGVERLIGLLSTELVVAVLSAMNWDDEWLARVDDEASAASPRQEEDGGDESCSDNDSTGGDDAMDDADSRRGQCGVRGARRAAGGQHARLIAERRGEREARQHRKQARC